MIRKGFTLIEILVTLSLVILLTSAGVMVSINNIQRNLVSEGGSDLKSMLVQARDYALAVRKISCTTSLKGWQVDINTSAKRAVLLEVCGSTTPFITKNFSSSLTLSVTGSSSILFTTVTGGTNLTTNSVTTISNSLTNTFVTVTPGGTIQ